MLSKKKKFLLFGFMSGALIITASTNAMNNPWQEPKATTDEEEQQMLNLALTMSQTEQEAILTSDTDEKKALLFSTYEAILEKMEMLKALYGEEKANEIINSQNMNFKDLETAQERLAYFIELVNRKEAEFSAEEKKSTPPVTPIATTTTTETSGPTRHSKEKVRYNPYSRTTTTTTTTTQTTPALNTSALFFSNPGVSTEINNPTPEPSCPISVEPFSAGMKIVHLSCGHTFSRSGFEDLLSQQQIEAPTIRYTPQVNNQPQNNAAENQEILDQLLQSGDAAAIDAFLEVQNQLYQAQQPQDTNLYEQGEADRDYEAQMRSSQRCPICSRAFETMTTIQTGTLPAAMENPQPVILETQTFSRTTERVGDQEKTIFSLN